MARTLIVPGVSVSTQFEVAPPLPARSGILGAVGVVDDATIGVAGLSTRQELLALYGPATQYSFPEALSALGNGVSEVVVSPVSGGSRAEAMLVDDDGDNVARLVARAAGPWAHDLRIEVSRHLASDGVTVRSVTVRIADGDSVIETHERMILSAGHDSDLFTTINRDSRVVVAVDADFGTELPALGTNRLGFVDSGAAAAIGTLTTGSAPHIDLTAANPGERSNNISVAVGLGRPSTTLNDGTDTPAMRIRVTDAAQVGDAVIAVSVAANAADGVDVEVLEDAVPSFSRTGLTTNAAVADALGVAGLLVTDTSDVLPASTGGPVSLTPTVTVNVVVEGVSTAAYEDLGTGDAVVAALAADDNVDAALATGADGTTAPDAPSATYLLGGRDAGLARRYEGQNRPDAVLELVPAPDTDGALTRMRFVAGSAPNTVRLETGVNPGSGFELRESFDNLVMDPDSPRYVAQVLADESNLVRAIDRYPRVGASTFPSATLGAVRMTGGAAPLQSAYEAAIDALALEDSVDMMLAGLQGWADSDLNGVEVQQAMLGHALAQATDAKPRIVIGTIPPSLNDDVAGIIDHAGQLQNRRFVLAAPSGVDGAVAGLLGHIEYFHSPTFKTIASPGAPLQPYRQSELNQLLGDGNVCVVAQRRGRGIVVVRGLSTDGSQISVIRVADRSVREVKAISDRFIGELNNADTRNALKQMIIARFSQMERDGAIVPSVDGTSPAFLLDVYASQADAASGIVRIDLAVRPVREIAFIYASLTIKI